MSFRVLVIPEDPTCNGYILKPLVERMLRECGKPAAKVTVLNNPRVTGYESAKRLLAEQIIDSYRHMDLLLFLPDRDGMADRSAELSALEGRAREQGVTLFCCAAVKEIETWLLAGHLDKLDRPWPKVREDSSVKENVFEPFLRQHGNARAAGEGREQLMLQTLHNYRGLLDRCPELAALEQRIRHHLTQS